MSYSNRVVSTPAGVCPVKLQSTKEEDVLDWAENIYSIGLKNNINYLPTCFIFFAQQFFDIFEEDYKKVCNIIRASYNTGDVELNELITKINLDKIISDKEKLEKKQRNDLEEKEKIRKRKEAKKEIKVEEVEGKVEVKELKTEKKIKIRRK